MENITKKRLVSIISKKTGITRDIVLIIVEAFAIEISTQLLNGNTVHMRGFGSFYVKHCGRKTARLIKKKRSIIIPPHDQPAFKPSIELKKKIKDKSLEDREPQN